MDYFASKSPKITNRWGLHLQIPRLDSMTRNVQRPTPIEHVWLMLMLGNFGAK